MTDKVKWVRLGDYIEQCDNRNVSLTYGLDYVRGISNTKQIMKTKADVTNDVIHKFYIVDSKEFIYNPRTTRMGDKVGLGYNDTKTPLLFSFNNIAFRIKAEAKTLLLPDYLYVFFNRDEFDRYAIVHSWGSATELFTFDDMCDVIIPLPSIEVQRELVDTYNGLKSLAEQNEGLIPRLSAVCQAYIVDCRAKYPSVPLGEYIEQLDRRNSDGALTIADVQGISTDKCFIPTKANMDGVSVLSYKIVAPSEFVYVADTSRRGDKMALALNSSDKDILVSSIYTVFRSIDKSILLPEYLFLLFNRPEFDRYTRFNSWGSARETFDWNEMCRVQIPLPPIDVQQAIVDVYHCMERAKQIATTAREKLKTLCPALVQRAAHS